MQTRHPIRDDCEGGGEEGSRKKRRKDVREGGEGGRLVGKLPHSFRWDDGCQEDLS